jgi:hypothetical protein
MKYLKDALLTETIRPKVVSDCTVLLDEEVDSKSGFSGFAIKSGYKIVKAMKKGMVPGLVNWLLDDFVRNMEPMYEAFKKEQGGTFVDYMTSRQTEVAEALLQVTDKRADTSKNKTMAGLYRKLRPSAQKHVEQAVPRLARMMLKYLEH